MVLCDVYQRVKAEHHRPAGLLQPLKVPEWKWQEIRLDFIVGVQHTHDDYDSICVIVDRLSKVAYFISVKTTYSRAKLAKLYMARMYIYMVLIGSLYQIEKLSYHTILAKVT